MRFYDIGDIQPSKEPKLYTWDEIKNEEGIYQPIESQEDTRILVSKDNYNEYNWIWVSLPQQRIEVVPDIHVWHTYKFKKLDAKLYLEIK